MSPADKFPGRLKRIREARGMSQEALARKVETHRVYIAQLEGGARTPSLALLDRLAKMLKVKVGDLVGGGTTVQIRLGEDPRVPFLFAKGDMVTVMGTATEDRGVIVDGLYTGAPPWIGGSYEIIYDIERDGGGFIKAKEISVTKLDE